MRLRPRDKGIEEHMDWWAPLGDAGEPRVVQLLDEGAEERVIGTEGHAEVLAATLTVAGQPLSVTARYKHMAVASGDDVVAEVDFRRRDHGPGVRGPRAARGWGTASGTRRSTCTSPVGSLRRRRPSWRWSSC